MKKLLVILTVTLDLATGHGQNLVQNPDFESYSPCPTSGAAQIAYATGWDSFRESCDYYNSCGGTTPANNLGYQVPHSGNGYAGVIIYCKPGFYREIIGGHLLSPLVIGQKYTVSFYVSLSIQPPNCAFASNKMGAKFTTVPYDAYTNQIPVNNVAPLHYDTIVTDTANWKLITGSIIADSAYTYIAIGNFFDNAHTDTLEVGNNFVLPVWAYYYIDDVSVTADLTGIAINNPDSQTDLFPNPFSDKLNISIKSNKPVEVLFYDITSRKIFNQSFTNSISLNTEQLSKGIYFYEVRNKNGPDSYRQIKKGKVVKE
jgi:hypothetical protein